MIYRIALILLLISFPVLNLRQTRNSSRKGQDFRISKLHPTVYLTFERTGKREPEYSEESDKGIWLRLHNNTRWPLLLDAYGAGGKAFSKGNEHEIGMFYGVEKIPEPKGQITILPSDIPLSNDTGDKNSKATKTGESEYHDCELPASNWCHVCSRIELGPGKSLLFSLPRETLCDNLMIYIVYEYKWEDHNGETLEPEHRIYFYGNNVPKQAR
jgi:hypothetical protein